MPPHLPFSLSCVAEFLNMQKRFEKIDGFLEPLEGYTLMQLAAHGEGVGAIMEIGSFLGRSTAFLAAGSQNAKREKVYAVDHFRGSPENQPGKEFSHDDLIRTGSTFQSFLNNLRQVKLLDHVVPIQEASLEAVRNWRDPLRLLFIDGEHSFEAAKADFESWSPFIVRGGYVCFHDIGTWPDVTRFYQGLLQKEGKFKEVLAVQSLRVMQHP